LVTKGTKTFWTSCKQKQLTVKYEDTNRIGCDVEQQQDGNSGAELQTELAEATWNVFGEIRCG